MQKFAIVFSTALVALCGCQSAALAGDAAISSAVDVYLAELAGGPYGLARVSVPVGQYKVLRPGYTDGRAVMSEGGGLFSRVTDYEKRGIIDVSRTACPPEGDPNDPHYVSSGAQYCLTIAPTDKLLSFESKEGIEGHELQLWRFDPVNVVEVKVIQNDVDEYRLVYFTVERATLPASDFLQEVMPEGRLNAVALVKDDPFNGWTVLGHVSAVAPNTPDLDGLYDYVHR